jgi:hypothetical protein
MKRITELGIPIQHTEHFNGIFSEDIDAALAKHNMDRNEFSRLFGIQTIGVIDERGALYPHDVEAVLERMMSGRKTGTQALWD